VPVLYSNNCNSLIKNTNHLVTLQTAVWQGTALYLTHCTSAYKYRHSLCSLSRNIWQCHMFVMLGMKYILHFRVFSTCKLNCARMGRHIIWCCFLTAKLCGCQLHLPRTYDVRTRWHVLTYESVDVIVEKLEWYLIMNKLTIIQDDLEVTQLI
jgi:hypothetical protein